MKTLIAIYDNLVLAEGALRSLRSSGIARDHMNLLSSVEDQDVRPYFDEQGRFRAEMREEDSDFRQERRGSVLAIGGIVASMGLFAIPALGPLLAAGPLFAGALAAGTEGATSDSIGALLEEVGVPQVEADLYTEALRRGRAVLVVSATPSEVDMVADILAMYGAVDLDSLASRWERERQRDHEMVRAVDAEAEQPVVYQGLEELLAERQG